MSDNTPAWPFPIPTQAPMTEGLADISAGKVGYWDTGGDGEVVILNHPASGSELFWAYQQPVFAAAGYRTIAWSRRNYYNSDPAPKDNPGCASEDLQHLLDVLKVDKFHIVGCAAGGGVSSDYAFSHPDRLLSMTVSSNNLGVKGEVAETASRIRPKEWEGLPRWFRELGPSYRAANKDGVAEWVTRNEKSEVGHGARQKSASTVTPELLDDWTVPTLLMTGACDTSTPPSVLRMIASRIKGSEIHIIPECGHSPYWERPDVFNPLVLDFIKRHPS